MTGLDPVGRAGLERATVKARQLLERDLAQFAEGRLGIYRDGRVDAEDALRLSAGELVDRGELVDVIGHVGRDGSPGRAAVDRLIREAAFTHLNRLVAIRIAEELELLPESLGRGRASRGFRDVLEVAPLLSQDETAGYWTYLRLCADELAGDAPVLFDPRNPLLALAPSPGAIDDLLDVLNDSSLARAWAAPDALGWLYQFFNTADERRRMREESGAPRDSRELAVRNQFFTPGYVVDFLVHNSLGRRLVEAGVAPGLEDGLAMLTDIPDPSGPPLSLDEVQALDPACGSGHFLLGCYEVLERAWALNGVDSAAAAERILPCLWGIDIDPRCAQVAAAALVLRARRAAPDAELPRPRVITARALPEDPDAWDRALQDMPEERRRLVRAVQEALRPAPVLGPLLKAEELLENEIRRTVPEAQAEGTLFAAMGVADDAFGQAESDVLAAVQRVADGVESTAAERLLAAEAAEAIRFVEAMRNRYDAVLMNPPFGEPVPDTKPYLRASYDAVPSSVDLMAAFVMRGLELCREGGAVGAITSRSGLFLSTFEKWRREVLLGQDLVVVADLGHGVMEQAMVEAAAYVVRPGKRSHSATRFIRLVDAEDRSTLLAESISAHRGGRSAPRVYSVEPASLLALPGAPVAYWLPSSLRDLFTRLPRIEGEAADVRQGSWPGDDFRQLRLWWEVGTGADWVPYAKGGEYAPFYGEPLLLVRWDATRRTFHGFYGRSGRPTHLPENVDYFFRPGLTWSRRTQAGFNVRILPRGCAFADKGPAIFARGNTNPFTLLAWLMSRPLMALLESVVSFGSYHVGAVQRMPWPGPAVAAEDASRLASVAKEVTETCAASYISDETSRRFVCPPIFAERQPSLRQRLAEITRRRLAQVAGALDRLAEAEAVVLESLEVDDAAIRFIDTAHGRLPGRAAKRRLVEDDLAALREGCANSSLALKAGEYVVDPLVEGAAALLDCHAQSIAESDAAIELLSESGLADSARTTVSYLVGCAFGRWDIRKAGTPQDLALDFDVFDALPTSSPGMLVDNHGANNAARKDYPLSVPSDGLLLDEPNRDLDIEAAVRDAAAVVEDSTGLLDEVEQLLRGRSLRDYLRRNFFRDHLTHYSKSRRKAPIYWQLCVPSRSWGAWVYAPSLSRETLFAVARHAARRERQGKERLEALLAEREAGGRGRTTKELGDLVAQEESVLRELADFREEAERIAALGRDPDLDDGLILNAAPLADLLPGWPDAAKERTKVKAGAYEWASVSRWGHEL